MQLQQPHCQKERYSRRWVGSVGHNQLTELGDLPEVLCLCSNLKTVPKEYKSWRTLKTFINLEVLVPNYDCFCNSNMEGLNLMIICKIILTTDPDFYYPFSLIQTTRGSMSYFNSHFSSYIAKLPPYQTHFILFYWFQHIPISFPCFNLHSVPSEVLLPGFSSAG